VALKIIDIQTSEEDLKDIQEEVAFQSKCKDKHITQYYASFIKGNELWISMEYLGGGSVADIVLPLFPLFTLLSFLSLFSLEKQKTKNKNEAAPFNHH